MIRDFCICTGWCAQSGGHSNPKRSKQIDAKDWLADHWEPYIRRFVKTFKVFLYESCCDLPTETLAGWEIQYADKYIDTLPYHHDWAASQIAGAMYCYLNNFDMAYIEQDCLVYGLDKALQWAHDQQANICYNCDQFSYAPGWAANSFVFVRWEFLPTFINRMCQSGIKDTGGLPLKHEIMFHHLFKVEYTNWPFGFDRKRPIDWSLPMFYAQQLSDDEIERFMAL